MKFAKALSVSTAIALIIAFGGTVLNYYWNYRFQKEVRENSATLAPYFNTILHSLKFSEIEPEPLIQLYLNKEESFFSAQYEIKNAAEKSTEKDSLGNDIKIFESLLRVYTRPLSQSKRYEFFEFGIMWFLGILLLLWLVPIVWYFLLNRIKELSQAIKGKDAP